MEPDPPNTFNPKLFSPPGVDSILVQMEKLSIKGNEKGDIETLLTQIERLSLFQGLNLDNETINAVNISTILPAIPHSTSARELTRISSDGRGFEESNDPNTQPRDNGIHPKPGAVPSGYLPFLSLGKPRPLYIRDLKHISARRVPVRRKVDFYTEAAKTIRKLRAHQEAQLRRKKARQNVMSRIAAYEARECTKSQDQLPAKQERKVRFNKQLKIIYPSSRHMGSELSQQFKKL